MVFFERETIEEEISTADKNQKKVGIKMYFPEYSEEATKQLYPENWEEHVGLMTLVLSSANTDEKSLKVMDNGDNYYNKGSQFPSRCK